MEFCYANTARLYYRDNALASAQGVQQGDPLGPLLFALALHPLVRNIDSCCNLDLQAWYFNDGTLIGDTFEVSKALSIMQEEVVSRGLHMNISKTAVYWHTADPRSLDHGIFPDKIDRPVVGVKLLRAHVSQDLQFSSQMVLNRMDKIITLTELVRKLRDPQCGLLLLRRCIGVSRLYFFMRTTCPEVVRQAPSRYDSYLFKYLRSLITLDGPGFGPLQQRLVILPLRDGGLGLYTMEDTAHYCFMASWAQTKNLQDNILRKSPIFGTSSTF